MKHHQTKIILFLIIILAVILRFCQLGSLPYPLNGDEKAISYYAWSISHFGTDEYGNKFPLYFPSIGDYKYPGYSYLSAPIIYFLGLNPVTARITSSLASVFLIILIYKFSSALFKSQKIGLISGFLLAISPWNITFSRTASESNLMSLLSFSGFYFLYQSITHKSDNKKNTILSIIFFTISFFTYPASRIFTPILILFIFLFLVFTKNHKNIKSVLLPLVFSLIVIPIAFINPASRARANSLSILSRIETRQEWITQSAYVLGLGQPTKPIITRIFFNKATALFRELIHRYSSHFSLDYLFINGDIVKLNAIHNFGNFYIFEVIFFLIGISLLINKAFKKDLPSFLIISGIIISPIAASTTVETPSAVRQLVGLPYFLIAISLGINFLTQKVKWLIIPIIILYLYFFAFLILSIFKIKPYQQPWTSDQGNQQLVDKVWQIKDQYKYVFIPNDPYIDFLFYKQIPPGEFLAKAKIQPEEIGKWNRVSQYQNIVFNVDKNCPKVGQKNSLYVCTGEEIPSSAKIVDLIRYQDTVPKFLLIEFVQDKSPPENLPTGVKYIKQSDIDTRWPNGIFDNPNQYFLNLFL